MFQHINNVDFQLVTSYFLLKLFETQKLFLTTSYNFNILSTPYF